MEIALLDQTRVFVFAAALGLGLGFFYDLTDLLSSLLGKKAARPFFDIFYCVVFMGCFIALTQLAAGGEIRWYLPGGIVLGLALYFCGFSGFLRLFFSKLEGALRKLGSLLKRGADALAGLFEPPRGC